MAIDYKAAYRSIYATYRALLRERIETAALPALIDWIRNHDRGPAVTSFTSGPERQLAYAIEAALRMERETPPEFLVIMKHGTPDAIKAEKSAFKMELRYLMKIVGDEVDAAANGQTTCAWCGIDGDFINRLYLFLDNLPDTINEMLLSHSKGFDNAIAGATLAAAAKVCNEMHDFQSHNNQEYPRSWHEAVDDCVERIQAIDPTTIVASVTR